MHSLRSAAVQYTNYGTGGAFELPTQSAWYIERIKHSLRYNKALFVVDEAVGRLRVYFMKFKVHFSFDLAHAKFYNCCYILVYLLLF